MARVRTNCVHSLVLARSRICQTQWAWKHKPAIFWKCNQVSLAGISRASADARVGTWLWVMWDFWEWWHVPPDLQNVITHPDWRNLNLNLYIQDFNWLSNWLNSHFIKILEITSSIYLLFFILYAHLFLKKQIWSKVIYRKNSLVWLWLCWYR